ncbi:MAG TPA: hypothetical protein VK773_06925 [Acidimicrobiales bacterium]|jgi:hypothetical protein|nr:hypothetical protein [Acidimicrobiales bacterium]
MGLLHRRQRRLGTDEAADWPRLGPDVQPRLRVLLETKDAAEADSYWKLLGRHGYDVSWCPGPSASSSCVLVEDGHCALFEQADFVVTALKPDDDHARPVLEHLHDQDCMKPIIAVGNRNRWNGMLDRFKILEPLRVRRELLPALEAAENSRRMLRSLLESKT